MKTWARWTLGALATVLVLAGTAVAAGQVLASRKMQRTVALQVQPIAIPTSADAVERGRYLYATRACADCHADNGGGRRFISDGSFQVAGPHISPGPGSVTARYSATDWVRAVRHGVKPGGQPALIMPSEDYSRLTDADLGALVAYIRQMPPVEGGPAMMQLSMPVKLLYAFGVVQDAAEKIDHSLPPQQPVEDGPTVENGRYIAQMCVGCHGANFSGGKVPGGPPDWPAAANLTPGSGSGMTRYASAQDFASMMRGSKRPDGSAIAVMPFDALRQFSDSDLQALHAYLQTLPPRALGGR